MKVNINATYCILSLLFLLLSCSEDSENSTYDSNEVINTNDALVSLLIESTISSETIASLEAMNAIELLQFSCLSIVYPIQIYLDDAPLIIEDMETLLNFNNENNSIAIIQYPIELLDNMTSLSIDSNDSLLAVLKGCDYYETLIDCVDFEYPVEIYSLNTDTSNQELISFSDNEMLHNYFLDFNVSSEVLFNAFDYPIILNIAYTNETLTVNSNTELQQTLGNIKALCLGDTERIPFGK